MFLNATTATPFLARFLGQEKGGLHKCIARFITYSSPWRADTWFPSLPRKECAGVRYVITKFSRMDGLPNFLTHGTPLARFARRSSAKKFRVTLSKLEDPSPLYERRMFILHLPRLPGKSLCLHFFLSKETQNCGVWQEKCFQKNLSATSPITQKKKRTSETTFL